MVTAVWHGTWMDEERFKKTCIKEKGRYPPAILRHTGSRLHAETGCKRVYAGEVFELQKKSLEAKETIGDGSGRKYANSQFF